MINFLKRFWRLFVGGSRVDPPPAVVASVPLAQLDPAVSAVGEFHCVALAIGEIDRVTFSVNEKKKCSFDHNLGRHFVKPVKLLPRMIDGRLELSTFCIDRIEPEEIFRFLSSVAGGTSKARADFVPRAVLGIPLALEADWVPNRHVNVLGWPEVEVEQLNLAQALSDMGLVTPNW